MYYCVNLVNIFCIIFLFPELSSAQKGQPCDTPDQSYGICINIKNCSELLNLTITRGRSDPNIKKFLRASVCGYIVNSTQKTPMVCCPQAKLRSVTPLEDTNSKNSTSTNIALPSYPDCGRSNATFPRVVGGTPGKLGDFPWLAILGYRNSKNPSVAKWLCAGTLITRKHILTAAHCVHRRNDLYMVRLGDLDLYSDTDGATPDDILLAKAKIHEDYNPTTHTNDIAILTLERPPLDEKNPPICLPLAELSKSESRVGIHAFVAGWGALYFNGPSSAVLQEALIPILHNSRCKEVFGNKTVIDRRILCAGNLEGGVDTCQGDSGGPLMVTQWKSEATEKESHLEFTQLGIVSYGFKCAERGFPGVYTRVVTFIDWIQNNLN